jgi:hypothetical protein
MDRSFVFYNYVGLPGERTFPSFSVLAAQMVCEVYSVLETVFINP